MTPLFTATYHGRADVVRLLLINGADPNIHSVIKCEKKNIICEVALNIAIRDLRVDIVEILLLYNAFFNEITIKKVQEKLTERQKMKVFTWDDSIKIRKLKKILKLLKTNYKKEMEDSINEYIKKSQKSGSLKNYFTCFQINQEE